MSEEGDVVWKTCNVRASGCQDKWNMSERAEAEGIAKQKEEGKAKYRSRYDACNNPECQKGP